MNGLPAHIAALESEAIHVLRDGLSEARNPVVLFSGGKDSTVLAPLVRRAFFPSRPPIPLLHIDSTWEFAEVLAFRDAFADCHGFRLIVHVNQHRRTQSINPFDHGDLYTTIMRTDALRQALTVGGYDIIFGGARPDEEATRAKERIVSVRSTSHAWKPRMQRTEFWRCFNWRLKPGETIRAFPQSNWTELDLWTYILMREIEFAPLYIAHKRKVVTRAGMRIVVDDPARMRWKPGETALPEKVRFRTLGCWPVTAAQSSEAETIAAVLLETLRAETSERRGRLARAAETGGLFLSNDGHSRATVGCPLSGPYAGLRAVLATMHGKEAAIVPAFQEQLELTVEIPSVIDTDTLGTFTGEIARAGTIREAAIAKARLGMAATGLSIGIASEGSYGPHPHVPFVPGGVELMVLVDDERGIVVSEHLIDDAPVYEHAIAAEIGDLGAFLDHIRFPDHAVIVRPHEPDDRGALIHKGLRTAEALESALATSAPLSRDNRALVQTDMRAHMNPTRMASIARLARALCDRLATRCPACGAPGYGQIDVETGLPCEWCGAPSIMVRHQIFGCVACEFREMRPRPDGRTHADPGHCPECNP